MSISVAPEAASRSRRAASSTGTGLHIARRYTHAGVDPFDEIAWEKRKTVITNPDGSVVFRMDDVEVPAGWSQLATDIVVSKYFRKAGLPGSPGHETSVRQVVHRIAHTVRWWGEKCGGYFAGSEAADAFEAELKHMLVNQIGAFNSPVWFNCGLHHEYGIGGSGGNFWWDPETLTVQTTVDSYSRPQVSACFIQSIGDDLMSIFELARNEARVFKYGSGTGTNFSQLRGRMEKLSGGGTSSGLMSFLEVLDKGAGATKSGGTTRRAAKMVVLDMDHPEIVDFVRWKVREEKKVAALVAAGYSSDFNGEAYGTVSGQNSNNSVRIPDRFFQAVESDGTWETTLRTNGKVWQTHRARELWHELAEAAWQCADPGVQYDDTIQKWHTCKATGRINATNPCSEFVFLDDTACNLASINLMKFLQPDGSFDIEGYRHANRVFFLAQEILVGFASYPTEKIAENSCKFRPLGLGYANLGTLLMMQGYPYDSDEARAYSASITALMTGEAYALSAEIAASTGPFDAFPENRDSMLDVMRLHRDAARAIDANRGAADLRAAAIESWDRAVALGTLHGYRNSQATVLAPTGTIGLLMDCDTTGVEPDFALVKFKKLAGGGYFKIVNQSVPAALRRLGYDDPSIERIVRYAIGYGSLAGAPGINEESLANKGLTHGEIEAIEAVLPSVLDVRYAFVRGIISDDTLTRLGVAQQERSKAGWNVLAFLGFTDGEIDAANAYICGTQTVEGAPGLDPSHLPVFDCANRCGTRGTRYIQPLGHVRMMAAVQPFLSGAISKTVNLPNEATVEEVEKAYFDGWKLGLKAIALYRDGSKLSQPLTTKTDDSKSSSGEVRGNKAAEAAAVPTPAPLRRRRLPRRRYGFTQEARIAGHKVFIRTGEYEDGGIGEIFIDMHKEGAAFRSMMNCFAISISMGLQYGVPLEDFVDQFVFTRFEPQGRVDGHDNLRAATSVIDYIFRVLGIEYLNRTDLAHIVNESMEGKITHVPSQQARTDSRPGNGAANGGAKAAMLGSSAATAEPKSRLAPARLGSGANADAQAGSLGGDSPPCGVCGFITIRNGTCFKCTNCGNSMGCS
jgi:ribonucleoside-diphosphate reductase alpha chain